MFRLCIALQVMSEWEREKDASTRGWLPRDISGNFTAVFSLGTSFTMSLNLQLREIRPRLQTIHTEKFHYLLKLYHYVFLLGWVMGLVDRGM